MKSKVNSKLPEIKVLEKRFADIPAGAKMLISSPCEISDYLEKIAPHERRTLSDVREDLALKHGVDKTCPVTTSIYLRLVASEAVADFRNGAGVESIVPFWRVIDSKSPIWKKLGLSCEESAIFSNLE